MNLRRALGSIVTAPASRILRRDIRDLVEQALATRSFVVASELHAVQVQVDALRGAPAADQRMAALEEKVASLEKKLSMAMGAVQASTATLTQVRGAAEEAAATARQALVLATTARATAESAAEGVSALEDRVADGTAEHGATGAMSASAASAPTDEPCRVAGCTGKHRAKGFCARHYQQWRRSSLEGFVGPDGVVAIAGRGEFRVDPRHAGAAASHDGQRVLIEGRPVA